MPNKNRFILYISLFLNAAFLALAVGGIYFVVSNTGFLAFIGDSDYRVPENINPEGEQESAEFYTVDLQVQDEWKQGAFANTRRLRIPKTTQIGVFQTGLNNPRGLEVDPAGNIYVAERNSSRILRLQDTNNDNIADKTKIIAENIPLPHSMDYHNGDLYIGATDQIIVLKGLDTEGNFRERKTIVSNLPTSGHSTKTVLIGPDNKLYVSIGSSCNACEEKDERRAAIMRYNLDGTNPEVFATGLRNTVGITFKLNPENLQYQLWGVDNGRDRIGDDIPTEEVNLIEKKKHYGWPYCYDDQIANPEYLDRQAFCKSDTVAPAFKMQAHSAPLSIETIPENSILPGALAGQLAIGFHGSWNRTQPTGYKVVSLNPNNAGAKTQDLVSGWLQNGSYWGRPVDIKFDATGNMYISDDFAGAVYIVYPEGV